ASMGVQLVNPGATVVCVTGEASIQMCIQELSTCKQYHLPIKIVNLNNRYMGMVRQWQEFFYGNRYAESYMDALPDFVKLAEAYGHVGKHIECQFLLLKVRAAGKDRDEMKRLADMFRGNILDVTDKSYTIELTGTGSKLDAFLQAIEPGVILETVRTGASGIGRGERILRI